MTSAVMVAALVLPIGSARAYEAGELPKVEAAVRADFPALAHLSSAELAAAMARGEDVAIFDVREEDEFAVSRLTGAQRVEPGAWGWQFVRDHGAGLAGKTVVFYCSVGVRSSKLAARVEKALRERGVKGVYNLEGGIFRWHNERRGLVDAHGITDRVHPYDGNWGKLIDGQDRISMIPRRGTAPDLPR